MTFFSVLIALFFEQLRALTARNPVAALLRSHAVHTVQRFDGGKQKHAVLGWLAVVLPWTLAVGLVYFLAYRVSFLLAFVCNVVVLYFTLGFRQFSHYFTEIHLALNRDDVPVARQILARWTGLETAEMPVSEIVRQTLVHAVIASHRHVFGVFFWFLLPIGPAGAVLYRVAEYLARAWDAPSALPSTAFSRFAQRAFYIIDWIPARLTSFGFAIVGNFEEAIYAWRSYRNERQERDESNDGVLLVTSGGALGAYLGPRTATVPTVDAPEGEEVLTFVGADLNPRALQSAVGLVWRAVVLWMILLLMVTLASWWG